MALTYSKQLLSGSTNGQMIEVDGTSSPGTTIHNVVATTTDAREEVYLYAMNGATTNSILTIEWGGTGTEDQVVFTVPFQDGVYQVIPGGVLTATTSIVRAFGTATGRLDILGWVNRAT